MIMLLLTYNKTPSGDVLRGGFEWSRLLDCIHKVCAADDAVPEVFAFGGSREEVGEAVGFQFFQALYSAVDIVTETVAGAGKAAMTPESLMSTSS